MTPLFKKLNFKNQSSVLILNHPTSFDVELAVMKNFTNFNYTIVPTDLIEFAIIFTTSLSSTEVAIKAIHKQLIDDAVLWFCYPKGTSKQYKCAFNRDNGWAALGQYQFEPVRAVSIDDDWSGLRFRKVKNIKDLNRNEKMLLSVDGKHRMTKDK